MRSGFTGDPFKWYISQPAKCGPAISHFLRAASEVRMNAPLRVPTRTRTPDINDLERRGTVQAAKNGSRNKFITSARSRNENMARLVPHAVHRCKLQTCHRDFQRSRSAS